MRLAAIYTSLLVGFNAEAQDELIGDYASFWDIPLGAHALELDPGLFAGYACGTDGGPPSLPLHGWTDFTRCPRGADTGLYEVQFRHDDEPEYLARAGDIRHLVATFEGTQLFTIRSIISALFDDDGFLIGLRAVTDPRVSHDERLRSISLRTFVMTHYDPIGWDCVDLTPVVGEAPIGGRYHKEICTQSTDALDLVVESRFYRKPGQYGIDPITNQPIAGLFESVVRFEMFLAEPIKNREERLASVLAAPRERSEAERNREIAMDCAGCDLAGIDLKRQDLTGANLAGANLAGANLHGALLIQANLTGADLTEANLNLSNLRQAEMSGAMLIDALMYGAVMDGANLSGADLTGVKAQEARMMSVNLDDARAAAVDFSRARLSDVTAINTYFGGSWFVDAQMTRGDFANADFEWTVLQAAVITDANLTGANFNTADLILADLRGSNLTGADFTDARLTQAKMANTNREDALLDNAFDAPP